MSTTLTTPLPSKTVSPEARLAIRKVVVLGAGTMGAQVAAHLAGLGLDVALLDMVPPGAEDRSLLAKKALKPPEAQAQPAPSAQPPQGDPSGNFEDDWRESKDADWVFEAVIEDPDIKRQLAKVAPAVTKTAVVTSNTSGLASGP